MHMAWAVACNMVMNGVVNNWPNHQSVIPWFSIVIFMGNSLENSRPKQRFETMWTSDQGV